MPDTPLRNPLPPPSRLATLAPWLLGLLVLAAGASFMAQRHQARQQDLRWTASAELAEHGRLIDRTIDRLQTLAAATPFVLHGLRPMQRIEELAAEFRRETGTRMALELSRLDRRWAAGDASAAGAGEFAALVSSAARLAPYRGPVLRAEEGRLVASQTIHRIDDQGAIRELGTADAVMTLDDLAEAAQLKGIRQSGNDVRLRLVPQVGEATTLFETSRSMSEPLSYPIALANGDQLVFEVAAIEGKRFDPFLVSEMVLVLIGALLAGIALHVLLRQHARLRDEVAVTHMLAAQRQRLLDAVLDHLPLMVVLRSAGDRTVLRTNAAAEPVLGRDRRSFFGQSYGDFLPSQLAFELDALDEEALSKRAAVSRQGIVLKSSEGERTLGLQRVPLFDEAGRAEYLLDVIEDRTERQRLDRSLTQQLRFTEHALATVPAPIYVEDEKGGVVFANLAFERFFGFGRADLVGRPLLGVGGRPLIAGLPAGTAPASEGIDLVEALVIGADGREHPVQVRRAAILDDAGRRIGSVSVVADQTERIAGQQRVERVNRTLQVISGINEAIVRTRDPVGLLERTCEILVDRGEYALAWFHAFSPAQPGLPDLVCRGAPSDLARQSADLIGDCNAECMQSLGAESYAVLVCTPDSCRHQALMDLASARGMNALAMLPIRVRGEVVGVLGIYTGREAAFGDHEERLLGELAEDLSHAMESISREERRRQAEETLRLSARVFENSSEGIMITDAGNCILMVNKAFADVTGYAAGEVIGKNPRILSSGRQDAGFYREMWAMIQRRGEWHGEVQNRRKSGEFYTEWLTISAVRDEPGEITNYVAVFSDITSAKQVEERLNFLANYDTLTGLPNRILFTDRLEQAIAQARANDRRVAVLFLDLDRFKLINETFGHGAGDTVLQEVTRRVGSVLRAGQSASRMGGDEFAIVLPDLEASEDAAKVASEIMAALGQPIVLADQEIYTSASIGVSVFPDDGSDVESLFKNADSAMYRAMEEGRNTFRFYHLEMNARSAERMSLETDLRRALERGELVMHYQPLIDSLSGRIVGAEALLRWHRPGAGYISPAAFVPMLEDNGLIVPVGEWILETACADNQAWRQRGFGDLFVAVNFSVVQLNDRQATAKLDGLLSKMGFDPRHLEIELTEGVVMRDAERGIRTLNEFRDIGTRLSIDDFGTGYSSLAYLKRLPIDTLKIDRSFITDTPTEAEAKAIVQAIIAMGHSLGLRIIAEGVQEQEQVRFLRQTRCDLLQGFYFSSAVDQAGFIELLKRSAKGPLRP